MNTVVYLCGLPGCCHELETVQKPYIPICPWCGTNMYPISGSEKPIPDCYNPSFVEKIAKALK